MTKRALLKAIKTKSKVYAMDYVGIELIDFSDDTYSYEIENEYLHRIKYDIKWDYYLLTDLYKNRTDAEEAYKALGL